MLPHIAGFGFFTVSLIVVWMSQVAKKSRVMADRVSQAQRSENMRRIRGAHTFPERLVRSALFRLGFRFRLHRTDLPGKPDLVFMAPRKVLFVNGCFWHGHTNCKYAKLPKTNRVFWASKMRRNRLRDRQVLKDLATEGWEAFVVWTCQLRRHEESEWQDVLRFLRKKNPRAKHRVKKALV